MYNQGMSETKPLTRRETEILGLLAEGLSNDEIAQKLVISPNTVKVHVRNIFEKMEVQSRTEATMEAVRRGWITVPGLQTDSPPEITLPTWPPLTVPSGRWQWLGLVAALLVSLAFVLWPQQVWTSAETKRADFTTDRGNVRTTPLPRRSVARWTQRSSLPTARSRAAAALVAGRLYVVGGETAQGDTDVLEVYDPTFDVWQRLSPRPVAARSAAAAPLQKQVVVVGGCRDDTALAEANQYEPETDSWKSIAPLPQLRCGGTLASWHGRLFFMGGWDGEAVRDTVYVYDPREDRWQEKSPLPEPRAFGGVVTLIDGIWYLGGHDGVREQTAVWRYDPEADVWQEETALPKARAGLAVAADGTSIYAIGGGLGNEEHIHERFDLVTRVWSTIESPRTGPWHHAVAAIIGPNLHVIGGWGGDYLAIHEAYQAAFFQFLPLGAQGAK